MAPYLRGRTLNIVPSGWVKDGRSYWPNYPSDQKINKAIKNSEEPGPGWKTFGVRILFAKGN